MNIESYLKTNREKVNEALERWLSAQPDWPPRLKEAIGYSLKAGGKRVRSILAMAACEACGGDAAAVMPVALSLEMIHTFSLIHDDLPAMDNDDLRRGQATNHKVFGEGMAILAGDGLLSEAFFLLGQLKNSEVLCDIALAIGPAGMIGGQVLDLQGEGASLNADDLEKIHRYKTGRLITVSVTSGAKVAGATSSQLESLKAYAERIGLAFQIADDILNVEGSVGAMGKAKGSDQNKKKATYPAILGLEASKKKAAALVDEAIGYLKMFDECAEVLRELARYIICRTN